MDNALFQKTVLEQLGSLGQRMDRFEKRQERFETRQEQFEQGQQKLQVGQQEMQADIQLLQEGQQRLVKEQQQLQEGHHRLEKGQLQLESGQRNIWECLDTIVLSQDQIHQDIQAIKTDVESIRQSQVRVEYDFSGKIKALYDFRETQIETNKHVAARLDRLEGHSK